MVITRLMSLLSLYLLRILKISDSPDSPNRNPSLSFCQINYDRNDILSQKNLVVNISAFEGKQAKWLTNIHMFRSSGIWSWWGMNHNRQWLRCVDRAYIGEFQSARDISKTNNLWTKQLVKMGSLHSNYHFHRPWHCVSVSWPLHCIFVGRRRII